METLKFKHLKQHICLRILPSAAEMRYIQVLLNVCY